MERSRTIAVIGGTGKAGAGLALRCAAAGFPVVIGSRDAARAAAAARQLSERLGRPDAIAGGSNLAAAAAGDPVILAVPYAAQTATAHAIAPALEGKLLIDVTVPLVPPKVARVQLPAGGSAVAALQARLGPAVRVVAAFQTIAAHALAALDRPIASDVLVCGDDPAARAEVVGLVRAIGLRGVQGGPLANAAAAEALTSVLIWINRTYRVPDAGLRITGLPDDA